MRYFAYKDVEVPFDISSEKTRRKINKASHYIVAINENTSEDEMVERFKKYVTILFGDDAIEKFFGGEELTEYDLGCFVAAVSEEIDKQYEEGQDLKTRLGKLKSKMQSQFPSDEEEPAPKPDVSKDTLSDLTDDEIARLRKLLANNE